MHRAPNQLVQLVLPATLALGVILLNALAASAQTAEDLDPAADFRTAPLVGDGTYRTELVSGERVWVSVRYSNRAGLGISALLSDLDVNATDELTLYREIIAPNLNVVRSTAEDIMIEDGNGPSWSGGETDAHLWFLAFTLETTGQVGVKHMLEFTLTGFVDVTSSERCGAGCTLHKDLADLEDQIAELEAQLGACGEDCSSPHIPRDIQAERDKIAIAIAHEAGAIADLCGGEKCDSPPAESTAPLPLVAFLGLTAAIAIGGLVRTLNKEGEIRR